MNKTIRQRVMGLTYRLLYGRQHLSEEEKSRPEPEIPEHILAEVKRYNALSTGEKCEAAVDDLNRYLTFESGWDGYFGKQFKPEDIAEAVKLVRLFQVQAKLFDIEITRIEPGPASDGSVDLEFYTTHGYAIYSYYAETGWSHFMKDCDLQNPWWLHVGKSLKRNTEGE